MQKIHSHYDNLTVSRNASPEVIRAAYRVLCQKYHPDKHNQNPEYVRIMSIINTSYQILMDPEQRRQHDIWLAEKEREQEQKTQEHPYPKQEYRTPKYSPPPPPQSDATSNENDRKFSKKLAIACALVIMFVIFCVIYSANKASKTYPSYPYPTSRNTQQQSSPHPQKNLFANRAPENNTKPTYTSSQNRPTYAPNGQPWPRNAGYLTGYAIRNTDGLSNVTINNRQGTSDIYLKLATVGGDTVRHLYIPKGATFTMRRVSPGAYILKYKQLDVGSIYQADSVLQINEIPTAYGTQFTNYEYTLYPVINGNTRQTRLDENEF